MMHSSNRTHLLTRSAALILALLAVSAYLSLVPARPALAWSASGPLTPTGNGTGSGSVTTTTAGTASVQVSLIGASPSATYAVFSCVLLVLGGFDCVGRNNPPTLQQMVVAPKALTPLVVTLVQQGTLQTDASGGGSSVVSLTPLLLPDTPTSVYNVVELINAADPTDAYIAANLQTPSQATLGANSILVNPTALTLGSPTNVYARYPGYLYPFQITALNTVPYNPYLYLPYGVFGSSPYSTTVGTCPNGQAPRAISLPNGTIYLSC
jgi:hypothetical protein